MLERLVKIDLNPYSFLTDEEHEFVKNILTKKIPVDDFLGSSAYEKLFTYFSDEMPYGIMKARDGDPDLWILDRLNRKSKISTLLNRTVNKRKTKAYMWDEISLEITEFDITIDAFIDHDQIALAVDEEVQKQCEGEDGTYDKKVREEDGVIVIDALFGQGKETRTYVYPDDPGKAEEEAARELENYIEFGV
jgi:hypothetical protein